MADEATKKYAVVTGGNRGIGLEVARQLALKGVKVVLTARDEKKGVEAVEKLKESAGLSGSDLVVFHQLDVVDPASIASLADFINTQFGKLDILVNNAGISGAIIDFKAFTASNYSEVDRSSINWSDFVTQTQELTEECLEINYNGAKRTSELLIPLLQLSDSPRIVNISSTSGKLENIPNEWAKKVLNDGENLTEERVDEVLAEFLKDFKEGSFITKGWPPHMSAYTVSKAALNAHTRILAKRYPSFCINCVCPGYVKTDINQHTGILSVEEGAASPVRLALLPNGGPSGLFFIRQEVSPF